MNVDEKINSKYEILTDEGFKPFSGIKKQIRRNYNSIVMATGNVTGHWASVIG